jgi:WD40-like Beta Propeller Repeat
MKCMRGLSAGFCLVLILSGCSKDKGDLSDRGVFSPLITGISASNEPAIRGVSTEFTLLVTNINNYPIAYHWSAPYGALTDSTGETVDWTAPDSVGTFPLTASIESFDASSGTHFFKTTTFQIYVDNEYERWTRTDEVQFDVSPKAGGGVVFAQFRNVNAGTSDIYDLPGPGLSPTVLTTGFLTAGSPTMRADGQLLAFQGRTAIDDSVTIWVIPGTGGDPSTGSRLERISPERRIVANPRFSREAKWILFNEDSTRIGDPQPWYSDIITAPKTIVALFTFFGGHTFWMPNWGPDVNSDGLPDSIVSQGIDFFGQAGQKPAGLFKLSTTPDQTVPVDQWLPDSTATEADWSSDGQYIIFTRPNPGYGDRDIWIIRADTNDPSKAVRVTFGPADDSHPRFSSDGQTIYFISNRTDRYGLNGIFNTERRGTNIWGVTRFDRP